MQHSQQNNNFGLARKANENSSTKSPSNSNVALAAEINKSRVVDVHVYVCFFLFIIYCSLQLAHYTCCISQFLILKAQPAWIWTLPPVGLQRIAEHLLIIIHPKKIHYCNEIQWILAYLALVLAIFLAPYFECNFSPIMRVKKPIYLKHLLYRSMPLITSRRRW